MHFQQLLLLIIYKFQGERSASAPYYLLRGKKSGQTIQDVTYFNLHPYFSLYPKLSKEAFDEEITALLAKNYIVMDDSFLAITEKGLHHILAMRPLFYNGWVYRGREFTFWKRMELIVQTLSHFQENEKRFIPVQKDNEIHHFVKGFLLPRDFQSIAFGASFKEQLTCLLENPNLLEIHRNLFVYRLSGYKDSGLTWEQLAAHHSMGVLDVKFLFIESLHIMLNDITMEKYPDISVLTNDVYAKTPLTDSALKTSKLFEKGYSLNEIAKMRFLKENTIEDHVIEIVSAKPEFPISSFIAGEQIQLVLQISAELQTKKLKMIREKAPDLSFFQIRLALTIGGTYG
ncbi:helix-turn-helix domain-containing protein [Bacillus sp. FJAT-22090]|uniref:helix-turn-helix domain-containing protein n=1 Tax=Bacillus sp. FJAT-22090 TaxID=1581038 RepID=UPI0011A126CA|nr:helix-turn-helix domain-containing protein [Bacillus sp. FJAT-22090]